VSANNATTLISVDSCFFSVGTTLTHANKNRDTLEELFFNLGNKHWWMEKLEPLSKVQSHACIYSFWYCTCYADSYEGHVHGIVLPLTSGSYMWQHGPHPKGPELTMHFLLERSWWCNSLHNGHSAAITWCPSVTFVICPIPSEFLNRLDLTK